MPQARQTLRQLLAGQGITEADWARANSTEGGGNKADREKIWNSLIGTVGNNGWGEAGQITSRGNDYSGVSSEGGIGGGNVFTGGYFRGSVPEYEHGRLMNEEGLNGYIPVNHGTMNTFLEDRGNYNQYLPDLGAIEWDPYYGLMHNQKMQKGNRVDRSFNNVYGAANAAIGAMATAGLANGLGVQGIPGFDQVGGMPPGFGPGDMLPNLSFNPVAGGSINATGAFAGPGTGFSGFGSAGLLGNAASGFGGELASVGESGGSLLGGAGPQSVTVNTPGMFSNLPNWAQNGLNNITSNPMNALRLGQGVAGLVGAARGGGSQPANQSGKSGGSGSGNASAGNVQRPQYTPNPHTQMQLQQLRRSGL